MKLNLKQGFSARLYVLFCLLLLISLNAFSQTNSGKTVTGTVKDSGGPLQGVSVKLKGTSMGTITDPKGRFSINAQSGQTLVFSAIGFESKEVLYTGQTTLSMTLTESFSKLNEVVVMGYG